MKIEKRIHNTYIEWKLAKSRGITLPSLIGKYQYIYSDTKGSISLIELKAYFKEEEDLWEIYCLDGELFEDVERFNSKDDAEKRIKELLN